MASHRQIEAVAGDWLARRDSGDWTDEDQCRLEQWLGESTLHRVAYLRLEDVWERAQRLRALGAGSSTNEIPPPGRWVFRPFFFEKGSARPQSGLPRFCSVPVTVGRFRVLVASVLLVAAAGVAWLAWPAGSYYRTPVGGLASVPMPDGSEVTLNTDSAIRMAVSQKERRIVLEQGEAYFEVAQDHDRPFVVTVGSKRVIAVGTKFSVRRNADDIQVVVTEGKVRVESTGSQQPVPAGSIARAGEGGVLVQKEDLEAAEEFLSWRSGILVFRDATLSDAVSEFNRYNIRKIVIADPAVASLQVAGSFRANNVDAFVRLLQQGYPLRAEPKDGGFLLNAR